MHERKFLGDELLKGAFAVALSIVPTFCLRHLQRIAGDKVINIYSARRSYRFKHIQHKRLMASRWLLLAGARRLLGFFNMLHYATRLGFAGVIKPERDDFQLKRKLTAVRPVFHFRDRRGTIISIANDFDFSVRSRP